MQQGSGRLKLPESNLKRWAFRLIERKGPDTVALPIADFCGLSG